MKATLESTTKIVNLIQRTPMSGGGTIGVEVPCRIWEGTTEPGVKFHAYIPRVAVLEGEDARQFEAELESCKTPSPEVEGIPLRLII